jgi:hypothetical protein
VENEYVPMKSRQDGFARVPEKEEESAEEMPRKENY